MNTVTLAHRWYHNPEQRSQYANVNTWFTEDTYFSYGTAIAQKVTGLDGREWVLISSNSLSSTTRRHIRQVVAACPHSRIVRVVPRWGGYTLSIDATMKDYEYAVKQSLTLQSNRLEILSLYESLSDYNRFISPLNIPHLDIVEECRLRQTKLADRKSPKSQDYAKWEGVFASMRVTDIARWFYSSSSSEKRPPLHIRKAWASCYSYIWVEGDKFFTSQGISGSVDALKSALVMFRDGKIAVGDNICGYTVQDINEKFIKIGCHRILNQNANELINELI